MDQANENAAQNANADGVEEMEVVPPHLDPIQQGAIIAALQHQIAQMCLEIDRAGINTCWECRIMHPRYHGYW